MRINLLREKPKFLGLMEQNMKNDKSSGWMQRVESSELDLIASTSFNIW